MEVSLSQGSFASSDDLFGVLPLHTPAARAPPARRRKKFTGSLADLEVSAHRTPGSRAPV
jgi:hypothetical protein